MSLSEYQDDSYTASYCAADDKLRLYTGRVPRPCYDILTKLGFKSTPKQDCDFVAVWTPDREDACFALIPDWADIDDEDYTPEERAADRAERFSGYREKRRDEAGDFADRYEEGPTAFGNQDGRRAERAANKHERLKTRGLGQWSKAEYWQQRTQGVIGHALHKLDARTRRGRILEIEKDIRKRESTIEEWIERWDKWEEIAAMEDVAEQDALAFAYAGVMSGMSDYPHPDNPEVKGCLYSLMKPYTHWNVRPITGAEAAAIYLSGTNPHSYTSRWLEHLKLRLAYEEAMLENEGGKAADVEMEPGGWLGSHQIHAVNRSPVTKRIVSVKLMAPKPWWRGDGPAPLTLQSFNIERYGSDVYRPPTDEEREAFADKKKAAKKVAKEKAKEAPKPSLINPTPECAKRLQDIWNESNKRYNYFSSSDKARDVIECTQANYSADPNGETVLVGHDGREHRTNYQGHANNTPVFKVRSHFGRVVVLTDKPQKKLPWEQMEEIEAGLIPDSEVVEKLGYIQGIMAEANKACGSIKADDWPLFTRAVQLGYASDASCTQKFLTDKGYEALNAFCDPISLDELKTKRALFAQDFIDVTDHDEISRRHAENKEKCKRMHLMDRHERPMEAHAIRGTGWYCLDYVSGGTAFVCTQKDFFEATRGVLQSA